MKIQSNLQTALLIYSKRYKPNFFKLGSLKMPRLIYQNWEEKETEMGKKGNYGSRENVKDERNEGTSIDASSNGFVLSTNIKKLSYNSNEMQNVNFNLQFRVIFSYPHITSGRQRAAESPRPGLRESRISGSTPDRTFNLTLFNYILSSNFLTFLLSKHVSRLLVNGNPCIPSRQNPSFSPTTDSSFLRIFYY